LAKVGAHFKVFLLPSYTTTINGQSGAMFYSKSYMVSCFLTMAYLIAPWHSLADGFRLKNKCCQKEDVT
jgi:hypothetical protein